MSKIDQIISEMEEYIEGCRYVPLSNSNIIVSKETMEEYLSELRMKTPDEIKKYQKIISNKDQILSEAKTQAEAIISAAQVHTEELVNEHEIMQRAYEQAQDIVNQATAQAQEILDRATAEANDFRYQSVQYTDEMLASLQLIIQHSIESNQARYDALLLDLNKTLDIVINNRNELRPQEETEYIQEEETPAEE